MPWVRAIEEQAPSWRRAGARAAGRRWRTPRGSPATGLALLAPAMTVMLFVNVYPVFHALWVALHRYDLRRPRSTPFVGLGNLTEVVTSSYFVGAVKTTLWLTVAGVTLVTLIGMASALILHRDFFGRSVAFALFLLPWAVPGVVNGLMWKWIYDSHYGSLNGLLYTLGLIESYQAMLGDPNRAPLLVINAFVWKEVPLAGLLFLSALKSIPASLYEAAMVDGAGPLARFRYVTLPGVRTALLLVLIYATMSAIRAFDIIYVLTEGGPGDATANLAWYAYVESFRHLNFGRGAALAYLVAIATFIVAYWYLKTLGTKEPSE